MRRTLNIWVVGGDMRHVKLARLLEDDGHMVHRYAMDDAPEPVGVHEETLDDIVLADCVVFPLPMSGEGGRLNAPMSGHDHDLGEIMDRLRTGQVLFAGRVSGGDRAIAAERGLELHDYFAREELAVANAVPTAEGAVQIAMEEMPITIHGARVLVLGFGRVGRVVANRMHVLGAQVRVAARKYEDLARAEAYGYGSEHMNELDGWLCAYDLVVNTVPVQVMGRERLAELKEGCVVIDLASKPGGVDFESAAELGVRVIWALSLPGKVAPVTAGKAICTTLYNMLNEMGI